MILLGVDPGSLRTGWGAIESDGRSHRLIEAGVLAPLPRLSLPEKLRFLHDGLASVIARLRPEAVAVEDVFHAANTRSALILGHVRGALLLAGAEAGLPVHAFSPATVKAQIAGFGRAEKQQVALMVSRILRLERDQGPGDAADALALALCLACQAASPMAAVVAASTARRVRRRA
ncbi:MAG TPA: crossover junction endodeoxyribonuclease RuvC [Vicinamibacteria bacterium]|nr:crossover junction endodeoxyribonuclease RuvC [Vicinamibacteria bacterium]